MVKKNFKNLGETAAAQFISMEKEDAENTQNTLDTNNVNAVQNTSNAYNTTSVLQETPNSKKADEYYRFNLKMPIEYKEFLDEYSWRQRKTITQYINDLIKAEMSKESNGSN